MTLDKAVKDISEDFLKGAVYGSACVAMSEDLEDFTNKSLKYCKAGAFPKGPRLDAVKAWDKGAVKTSGRGGR